MLVWLKFNGLNLYFVITRFYWCACVHACMRVCIIMHGMHACMCGCCVCVLCVCGCMIVCVDGGGIGLFMLESTIIANIQLKLIIIIHYEKCHHKQLQKKCMDRGAQPLLKVCVCGGEGGRGGGGGAL